MSLEEIRIGIQFEGGFTDADPQQRAATIERARTAGIDQFFGADHVSFHTGWGQDGLIRAATVTATAPAQAYYVGVYLLALRHPTVVARQLSTLAETAPGRVILGVGVGGEDRHEMAVCGIDPATRGRRTDECLRILRPLMAGETVTFSGEFLSVEAATIRPVPAVPVPIVVGGRADAALRRAGALGDGWLGIWSTPARYRERLEVVMTHAERLGRASQCTRHGLQLWAGLVSGDDDSTARARERLGARMASMYRVPFERFERYSPVGTADDIAEALLPYLDAGCREFNIALIGRDTAAVIDGAGLIRERLNAADLKRTDPNRAEAASR